MQRTIFILILFPFNLFTEVHERIKNNHSFSVHWDAQNNASDERNICSKQRTENTHTHTQLFARRGHTIYFCEERRRKTFIILFILHLIFPFRNIPM